MKIVKFFVTVFISGLVAVVCSASAEWICRGKCKKHGNPCKRGKGHLGAHKCGLCTNVQACD